MVGLGLVCGLVLVLARVVGLVCGLVCHQVAPCAPAPPHTPLQARFCTGIMRRKMVITMIMIIGMIILINVLLCKPSSA